MTKKRTDTSKKKRKPDTSTGDRTAKTGSGKKVWRIFHFEQRFEMDDYRRQGGLDYVRMFVTATTVQKSNESTEFFQQLKELRFYYPDKYYSFFGIFWTLASLTATREDWLRGYLLDGDLLPLSERKLAARLQISLKETRAALLALKRVGLIEYKPCPEFNKPEREKEKSGSQKQTKNKRPNRKKSDTGTSKKAAIRKRSETFPNVSKPFKNSKRNSKRNNNINEKKENKRKKSGILADSLEQENQKTEEKEKHRNAQAEATEKSEQTESPTKSEIGAAEAHIVPKPPHSAHSGPQSIGAVIGQRFPDHWQDGDAEAFGWSMVEALGMPRDPHNLRSRSEWGAFASWWSRVKKTAAVGMQDELRRIAVVKADYVRRKAKSARNKSAVWFKIMDGEMLSRGVVLPPSRAGPAACG